MLFVSRLRGVDATDNTKAMIALVTMTVRPHAARAIRAERTMR
jgi:hypothetical protein